MPQVEPQHQSAGPAALVEAAGAAETAVRAATQRTNQKQHQKWNRRMKIFFCCLGYKKNKESIADVASIFAEFYSDLNVPSSDIAAGFVLLSKYQAAQRQWILDERPERLGIDRYLSNIPIRPDTQFLDISTAEDSHLINDLIYYMNYSLAIFGWPMSMVDDPCLLCCIYPYLRLSPCCFGCGSKGAGSQGSEKSGLDESAAAAAAAAKPDKSRPVILEDNCCGCNAASAERRLAQHNYEIVYISYKSSINVVPFLVAADHSKQTIVVAIRGSMSLSDMVTDMNGTVDKVPIEDCPDDWLCHRGITRAAQYVKRTLIEERILERAFECRPELGSKEYQLILCGHSLGAGAAAILGVLLRGQYPELRAFLYSPPGGILSMSVVEYTKQFATGIILGNDTVPRLGVAQLERLRYQTLLSLNSTRKSSGRILARAFCPSMCFGSNKVDYDPGQSIDLLYGTEASPFDHNGTKIPFQVQPQVLYVPGRLIHVVKNYSFQSRRRRLWNGPIYQAVWTDNASYDRILISEGMFFDHLPNNLMHAMKMLFSRTLPGRPEPTRRPSVKVAASTEACGAPKVSGEGGDRELAAAVDSEASIAGDIEEQSRREVVGEEAERQASDGEQAVGDRAGRRKHVIEDDNNNNNQDENNNNTTHLGSNKAETPDGLPAPTTTPHWSALPTSGITTTTTTATRFGLGAQDVIGREQSGH